MNFYVSDMNLTHSRVRITAKKSQVMTKLNCVKEEETINELGPILAKY